MVMCGTGSHSLVRQRRPGYLLRGWSWDRSKSSRLPHRIVQGFGSIQGLGRESGPARVHRCKPVGSPTSILQIRRINVTRLHLTRNGRYIRRGRYLNRRRSWPGGKILGVITRKVSRRFLIFNLALGVLLNMFVLFYKARFSQSDYLVLELTSSRYSLIFVFLGTLWLPVQCSRTLEWMYQ